jgi:hypothetical protein
LYSLFIARQISLASRLDEEFRIVHSREAASKRTHPQQMIRTAAATRQKDL